MSPQRIKAYLREGIRSLYFGPDSSRSRVLKWLLVGVVPAYKFLRFFNQAMRVVRRRRLSKPVISIGNISIGGTAKTSFVRWLCNQLLSENRRPAILKRGQGQREGVVGTGMDLEEALEYGDEVALLRQSLPSVPIGVGSNRYEPGHRLVKQCDIDCFVMDDGFQHRQLVRDLDVVLLGSSAELSEWELPAGPLREPTSALERADVVSLNTTSANNTETGFDNTEQALDLREDQVFITHRYRFDGIYRKGEAVTDQFLDGEVHLLTTQARPDQLEVVLQSNGFDVTNHHKLGDHDRIPQDIFNHTLEPRRTIVTDKEWVKLPSTIRNDVGRMRSELIVEPSERFLREVSALVETDSQ